MTLNHPTSEIGNQVLNSFKDLVIKHVKVINSTDPIRINIEITSCCGYVMTISYRKSSASKAYAVVANIEGMVLKGVLSVGIEGINSIDDNTLSAVPLVRFFGSGMDLSELQILYISLLLPEFIEQLKGRQNTQGDQYCIGYHRTCDCPSMDGFISLYVVDKSTGLSKDSDILGEIDIKNHDFLNIINEVNEKLKVKDSFSEKDEIIRLGHRYMVEYPTRSISEDIINNNVQKYDSFKKLVSFYKGDSQ